MNGRRLLGETLGEIAMGVLDSSGAADGVLRITSLELDLPIDVRLALDGATPALVGDVPLARTRTDFDPPPARFQITMLARPIAEATP